MQAKIKFKEAIEYLNKKDKKLAELIKKNQKYCFEFSQNSLESLLYSITSQQISFKVANTIWQRIIKLVTTIKAENILLTNKQDLKNCGLSSQKIQYFENIAQHFKKNKINDKFYWSNRSYQEIHKELIQIKGIGNWTIEMFAIYFLQEADIMPLKDLGIIRAINVLHNKNNNKYLEKEAIINITNNWIPYRSFACLFLWLLVDN